MNDAVNRRQLDNLNNQIADIKTNIKEITDPIKLQRAELVKLQNELKAIRNLNAKMATVGDYARGFQNVATAINNSTKSISQSVGNGLAKQFPILRDISTGIRNQTAVVRESVRARYESNEILKGIATGIGKVTSRLSEQARKASSSALQGIGDIRREQIVGFAEGALSAVGGALKNTVGKLSLMDILKGVGLFTLLTNPEAFARAIKTVTEGFVKLAELFQSKEFQEGVGSLFNILAAIGKFGIESFTKFLDGIAGISNAIDDLMNGRFDWSKLGDLVGDIGNLSVGLAGLSLLVAPKSTLVLGFKLLSSTIGTVANGFKLLAGILGAPAFLTLAALFGVELAAPASTADGTLDGQRDSQGLLPGDPGYDGSTRAAGATREPSRRYGQGGRRATGGMIPGMGEGDSVHALLEPGEYVLNKNLVSAIGVDNLNDMNFAAVPRFQRGGLIDIGPFAKMFDVLKGVVNIDRLMNPFMASSPASDAPSIPVVPGSTPNAPASAKMMYDYIVSKGYTPAQAKGIVANIQRESSFNARARSGDDGGPGGLFQWKGSRQTPQVAALVNSGDWKGQIDYALREDVGPQYRGATAGMTAQQAADWWMRHWERPADLVGGSRKHAQYLSSYRFQKGGMVRSSMKTMPSVHSSEFQSMSRSSRSSGLHDLRSGSQPIIVPVPMGGGGGQSSGSTTGTSSVPTLSASPRSAVSADYISRVNFGVMLS